MLQRNNIRRLQYQAEEADRSILQQSKQLISCLNESNVLNFCKHQTLGTIYLPTILTCHILTTHIDKSSHFFIQLTKKIRVSLKKYADTIVNKEQFLEMETELKENGSVHRLHMYLGSKLFSNGNETYQYLCLQMQSKMKKLQNRFVEKTNESSTVLSNGYIYMIRTRACINSKESVYKVGKTHQAFKNRMNGYDKGYETILVIPIPSIKLDQMERSILEHISKTFIQRVDYGQEYFEGNRMELVEHVMFIIQHIYDEQKIQPHVISLHSSPSKRTEHL